MSEKALKSELLQLKKRLDARCFPIWFFSLEELLPLYHAEKMLLSNQANGDSFQEVLQKYILEQESSRETCLKSQAERLKNRLTTIRNAEKFISSACEDLLSHPMFSASTQILFQISPRDQTWLAEKTLRLAKQIERLASASFLLPASAPPSFPMTVQSLRALCCLYREDISGASEQAVEQVAAYTHTLSESFTLETRIYQFQCELLVFSKGFVKDFLTLLTFEEEGTPVVSSLSAAKSLYQSVKTYRIRLNHMIKSNLEEMENHYEALHTRP